MWERTYAEEEARLFAGVEGIVRAMGEREGVRLELFLGWEAGNEELGLGEGVVTRPMMKGWMRRR